MGSIIESDKFLAYQLEKLEFNINTLGFKVSTGPVVPFRASEHLLTDRSTKRNYVPLIWMQNIIDGRVVLSYKIKNKPAKIKNNEKSRKLLVPKGNYVLVKRLSSKEGKQRINAAILFNKDICTDFIGIENHVNYIYKKNSKLTIDEAYGITALLNSKTYNRYFQMMNGCTQVNADEIKNLPLPSIKKIKKIGILVRKNKRNNPVRTEKIVLRELKIRSTG